jgi:hypothetical protein
MSNKEAKIFLKGRIKLIDKYYPQVEDYREALDMAIKAIEKVETYEKMMDELLEPKYGDYIQHKFTHEYGDVVTVEDLRYTFDEYRRNEE